MTMDDDVMMMIGIDIVDDDDDDHGRTSFNDKFHFEQFRTAQATTVPIPGALDGEPLFMMMTR